MNAWTQWLPFFIVKRIAIKRLCKFRQNGTTMVEAFDDTYFAVPNCKACGKGYYRYLETLAGVRCLRCTKCPSLWPEGSDYP